VIGKKRCTSLDGGGAIVSAPLGVLQLCTRENVLSPVSRNKGHFSPAPWREKISAPSPSAQTQSRQMSRSLTIYFPAEDKNDAELWRMNLKQSFNCLILVLQNSGFI
jgi:hypothetical protein